MIRRLKRSELPEDTESLARYLIGKTVVHDVGRTRLSGRIVETEAYVIGDAAGHAYRGPTPRNHSLFLKLGHAYVYVCYGRLNLLNVSSERAGLGAGVLIRALEPMDGIAQMQRRRGTSRFKDLTRGPGCLTVAIGVGMRHDGVDLCGNGPLWLGTAAKLTGPIGTSIRIGLTRDAHRLLRFYERGNPFVSGPRRLNV